MKRTVRFEHGQAATNSSISIVFTVLVFGLIYAVVGSKSGASEPLVDFSLVTLNKGLSLSACILLTCGFIFVPLAGLGIRLPQSWINSRQALGMTGFLLVLIHALVSLLLFNPSELETYFKPDGSMSTLAGIGMLCGVCAFAVLSAYNLSFQTFLRADRGFDRLITSAKSLRLALLLGAAHLLIMNYQSWLEPSGWPGGLPPVSLLSFVVLVLGISIRLLGSD